MTHFDHAGRMGGGLPVDGDSEDAPQLEVTGTAQGGIAIRNSADPTGPALVVPRAYIHDLAEAKRAGVIDDLLTRTATEHPAWCAGAELPGGPHRSSVLLAHRPGDPTEVRIWIMQPAGTDVETVMISAEEADGDRKRLTLTDQRIERLVTAAETLEDLAANWMPWLYSGGISHPAWCDAPSETAPGLRHRSDRQTISVHSATEQTRSEVIDLQLVQTIQRRGQPDNPTRVLLNTCTDYEHTTWFLEIHQLPLIRLALAQVSRWRSRKADQDDAREY